VLLALIHCLAVAASWMGLPPWSSALITLGLAISFCCQLAAALLLLPASVHALRITEDGKLVWRDRDGAWHAALLGRDAYASPWLVIVPLACESGRVRYVVLLTDSAEKDALRRLRVWLRWARQDPGPSHPA
jgi:hypothetical protein